MTATPFSRASHMDVSNTVDVTDPTAVGEAVRSLLESRYVGFDFAPVDILINDFARLLEGHEMSHSGEEQLGPEMALMGIACALFHDSGYIRRNRDTRHTNGAAYTRTHVSRGARFMAESESERILGTLLGTADLIAQMADAEYLRKCRDYLYAEFEAGGMAGEGGKFSSTGIVYQSPQHLLDAIARNSAELEKLLLDGQLELAHPTPL